MRMVLTEPGKVLRRPIMRRIYGLLAGCLIVCAFLFGGFVACDQNEDEDDNKDNYDSHWSCSDACDYVTQDCKIAINQSLEIEDCKLICNDNDGMNACRTECVDTYLEDQNCVDLYWCLYHCDTPVSFPEDE